MSATLMPTTTLNKAKEIMQEDNMITEETVKPESLKERLEEALIRYEISQSRAAREMNYSGSVLSAYRAGTYSGDVAKLEEAITKWLSRKAEAAQRKHVPTVETAALKQVLRAIRLAHDEKDIALIVADAGSGKTTAALRYEKENDRTTIFIKCPGAMSKRAMTLEIARQLGIETVRVSFDALVDSVALTLREREMVVIMDEADGLKDDALEFSRRLVNDLGETGLVLIGLPRLVHTIRNLKNDHRQLESRIGVYLPLDGLSKVDAKKIIDTVWQDAPKEIVDAVYDISGKDVRQFVKVINRTQNIMSVNKAQKADLEMIEMAGSMILKRAFKKAG